MPTVNRSEARFLQLQTWMQLIARWIVTRMGRNRSAGSVRLRVEPCGKAASPVSVDTITTMNQ